MAGHRPIIPVPGLQSRDHPQLHSNRVRDCLGKSKSKQKMNEVLKVESGLEISPVHLSCLDSPKELPGLWDHLGTFPENLLSVGSANSISVAGSQMDPNLCVGAFEN